MKAKVKYSSGLMLIISKNDKSPMLFLEYLSNFRAGKNILHHIQTDSSITKEAYLEFASYINSNL